MRRLVPLRRRSSRRCTHGRTPLAAAASLSSSSCAPRPRATSSVWPPRRAATERHHNGECRSAAHCIALQNAARSGRMPVAQHAGARNMSCNARGAALDAVTLWNARRATSLNRQCGLALVEPRAGAVRNDERRSNVAKATRGQRATGASWRASAWATRGRAQAQCVCPGAEGRDSARGFRREQVSGTAA